MPTLTHPFAPIKHFLTDPYHYENKHELDRPYAITGGFSELQNIPIVGNLVDGTVGRILKPRKEHKGLEKAHEEYISSINQYIQDKYSPVKDGSYVGISGTGAVTQYNMYADRGQAITLVVQQLTMALMQVLLTTVMELHLLIKQTLLVAA